MSSKSRSYSLYPLTLSLFLLPFLTLPAASSFYHFRDHEALVHFYTLIRENKVFPKRDTFTSFLIPVYRLPSSTRDCSSVSRYIFFYLFSRLCSFSSVRYFHSLSDLVPSFSLSSHDYEVFLLEICCRFYLFAIATCFFFLSRHNAFTFFPISETRRLPSLSKDAFRDSWLQKYPHCGKQY